MTYNNVNEILMNNIIPEGYGEFASTLKKNEQFSTYN